jgi:hypothetical protein
METTSTGTQAWPWPDALDALVAAPAHHQLLLENEHVRVLEVRIRPGDLVPVHTHKWSSVMHVKSASDFIRRHGEGRVLFDSRNAGPVQGAPSVVWTGPLPPHSVENIGGAEIHLFSVELKNVTG